MKTSETKKEIKAITAQIIKRVYTDGDKATLANLRVAASLTSPQAVRVWPLLLDKIPAEFLSSDGKLTAEEIAIFTALRFYALHQQGVDGLVYGSSSTKPKPEGTEFFTVLNTMRQNVDVRKALDRSLNQFLISTNINSVINSLTRLGSIIKQRNRTIAIDYADLASDLYTFQQGYEQAGQIRLKWGSQYYQMSVTSKDNQEGAKA